MAEAAGGAVPAGTAHTLTPEERAWCLDLKRALAEAGVAHSFTDFEVAQFALVGKGKTDKALKRAQKYVAVVVQQYGYVTARAATNPALGKINREVEVAAWGADIGGAPVMASNTAAFIPGDLDAQGIDECINDMCIAFDAMCYDLDAIRSGTTFVSMADGMGWKNYSHSFEKACAQVYQDAYPIRYNMLPIVGGGWIMTGILKLARLFLKKKMREKMVLCSAEDLYSQHGFTRAGLPSIVAGGVYAEDWAEGVRRRLGLRAASLERVKI